MDKGFKVKTAFNNDMIQQTYSSFSYDVETIILQKVLKIGEQQIKDALIQLGWTPPKSENCLQK